jgi:protein TonB
MKTLLTLSMILLMHLGYAQDDVAPQDNQIIYVSANVDTTPSFPGGMNKLMNFILKNYTPSDDDIKAGRVMLTFVVEKDGQLTDIKAVRTTDNASVGALIRLMEKAPKWNPAKLKDTPVRCSYSLPISLTQQ